jgi:hypothetical protein
MLGAATRDFVDLNLPFSKDARKNCKKHNLRVSTYESFKRSF